MLWSTSSCGRSWMGGCDGEGGPPWCLASKKRGGGGEEEENDDDATGRGVRSFPEAEKEEVDGAPLSAHDGP